jgi:hypothetical protein
VVLCKRDLTSLALNRGSQQRKNLIIIKREDAPAPTVGARKEAYILIRQGRHGLPNAPKPTDRPEKEFADR